MRLEAEIVATGDELMTGAIQDTNSAFVCRVLRENGVFVRRTTMVGDPQPEIETAIREATSRAPVVIVSGGLGPTEDDRTTVAAAAVAGVPLERNEAVIEHIKGMFRRFNNSEMTPNNAKQADFPKGSEILDNPIGTAPGFMVTYGKSKAFFLPGVPREHKKMFLEQVLPRVARLREAIGDTRALATRVVKTYGWGESKLEHDLKDVRFPPEIMVGYRARYPEIHLRLYAEGEKGAIDAALKKAEASIRERIGPRVYGVDDDSFASVLGSLLIAKGWRIALAESCTGGMIGELLTEVPGSSAWFDRGWITYSNESKTAELGVPADVLVKHGAVSEECVYAMANGARERSGAPIALAVTGVAGPGGGTAEKPVGRVWIACATKDGVDSRKLDLVGDRDRIRMGAAFAAMDLARRHLLGLR